MMDKELFDSYQWLVDSVGSFSDEARLESFDYDTALAFHARVGKFETRKRHGLRLHFIYHEGGEWIESASEDESDDYLDSGHWEGGEDKLYSLNDLIDRGLMTREQIIDEFKSKLQAGV